MWLHTIIGGVPKGDKYYVVQFLQNLLVVACNNTQVHKINNHVSILLHLQWNIQTQWDIFRQNKSDISSTKVISIIKD
jgi:hypothetical protein